MKKFEKMKNLSLDGQLIFNASAQLMNQQLVGVDIRNALLEDLESLAAICVSTVLDVYNAVVEDELTPRTEENDY